MSDFTDLEDGVRFYVAHGLEKSMSLKDQGGWPDYEEVTEQLNRMDNSELLSLMSMVLEEHLSGRLLKRV